MLGGQVEILVVDNLVPHAFGVDGEAVGGYPPVVLGQEDAALELLVFGGPVARGEARAELVDLFQELFGLQDLVRERGKGKVKVVVDLGVLEPRRLGDGGPDPSKILDQGVAQVGQGRVADVVADDEKEQRPCL